MTAGMLFNIVQYNHEQFELHFHNFSEVPLKRLYSFVYVFSKITLYILQRRMPPINTFH